MGLVIGVHNPALDSSDDESRAEQVELDQLSADLAARGHTWSAPLEPLASTGREPGGGVPYSWLARLYRVAALLSEGRPVTPLSDYPQSHPDREVVLDAATRFRSHLICHSDCTGYYVPVDLGDPLQIEDEDDPDPVDWWAQWVGSSQGLRDELVSIAPAIGLRLDAAGGPDPAQAVELAEEGPDDHPFAVERVVWLLLYECCRVSIASGHAIYYV